MRQATKGTGHAVLAAGLIGIVLSAVGCLTPEVATGKLIDVLGQGADVGRRAATKGEVRGLINQGANVNGRNRYDETPLHKVISGGSSSWSWGNDPALVLLLLEHGADPNAKSSSGRTPLHSAIYRNKFGDRKPTYSFRWNIVTTLLKNGANPNTKDHRNDTPLHDAVFNVVRDEADFVELLLEYGANPNTTNNDGYTPLHEAVRFEDGVDRWDLVRDLLEYGANPNTTDNDGDTPLNTAARNRYFNSAWAMLEHGADPSTRDNHNNTPLFIVFWNDPVRFLSILERDRSSEVDVTPLLFSALRREPRFVPALLEHGADANARTYDGDTPLHLAVQYNEATAATAILERGADPNVKDRNGRTPLYHAAFNDDGLELQTLTVLLKHGANPNVKDDTGATALHRAAEDSEPEVVTLLLDHGADPNAKNTNGETPLHLHYARFGDSTSIGDVLVSRGADVNAVDEQGITPKSVAQHMRQREADERTRESAAKRQREAAAEQARLAAAAADGLFALLDSKGATPEAIRLLLDRGADPNATDSDGNTPLHRAVYWDNLEAVALLLAHGADPNARSWLDQDGVGFIRSPLHMITHTTSPDVVDLLLKHGAEVNSLMASRWPPFESLTLTSTSLDSKRDDDDSPRQDTARDDRPNIRKRSGDYDGSTPLQIAISKNNIELVAVFLTHGADVHDRVIRDLERRPESKPEILAMLRDRSRSESVLAAFYSQRSEQKSESDLLKKIEQWSEERRNIESTKAELRAREASDRRR